MSKASRDPLWKRYINRLTNEERYRMLVEAIERLLETEDVRYQQDDIDCEECLYWESCGEPLGKETR